MNSRGGIVYMVGAGPGDPGLLTLRGAECLRSADVVVYDYLVNPRMLEIARRGAELICLGRHGQGRLMSQSEVNAMMLRLAREGKTVVRLKGGDPLIFGRAAEELSALESAGVPYEIVPGISAAQAAGSHAGIPLTDRDEASCVAIVTGQEAADKRSDSVTLDYAALARFPGTLVFYMGVTTSPHWSRALMDHGMAPETPVAVVRRCTLPDQETIYSTLKDIADVIASRKLRPTAIIIVGDVARQAAKRYADHGMNWFTSRPLFGRTILVTRPERQADRLSNQLRELGANVLAQPAIEIAQPADWSVVDAAIGRLGAGDFDWLVFSSRNGVEHLMRRIFDIGYDARQLAGVRLAAIGPTTADALSEFHLHADAQPTEYRAETLAATLAPKVAGKRVLLARANRGREVLAEMLAAASAHVEQVVVYESRDVQTQTLAQLGRPPTAVARNYTAEGVVAAILSAEGHKP
jgi:uroporphyrinogen III methyltransferase/synthase